MAYVVHDCKNCKTGKCNNRWIDKDLTHCKSRPPMWKYCREILISKALLMAQKSKKMKTHNLDYSEDIKS